jgi:hypothetical protein
VSTNLQTARSRRPQVSEDDYRVISLRKAVRDPPLLNRGGIGEVERWRTPQGEVCAYLFVSLLEGRARLRLLRGHGSTDD